MLKFWLVGRVDEKGDLVSLPRVQYSDESAARTHAEQFARQNVGERYVLLEATDTVRKSDICWEPCYDSLPF